MVFTSNHTSVWQETAPRVVLAGPGCEDTLHASSVAMSFNSIEDASLLAKPVM
jgi:hypothetical protein